VGNSVDPNTARRPLTPVPPLITISAQAFTATELSLAGGAEVIRPLPVAFSPGWGAAPTSRLLARGAAFAFDFKPGRLMGARLMPSSLAAPDQIRHASMTVLVGRSLGDRDG
jgi:hypothetical protein